MSFKNQIQKLKNLSIVINISKMLTGTVVGQSLSIILVPLATRIYGADYFGDFAVFVSMSAIILCFLGFGMSSAIMVAKDDEEAQGLYKLGVYGTGAVLIFLLFVLLSLSPFFQIIDTKLNYRFILLILMFSIFLANMINMSYAWLNRLGKFDVLLFNPIISPIVNNIFLLPMGIWGLKDVGLYAGYIFGQVAMLVHMQKHMGKIKYTLKNFISIKFLIVNNKDFIIYQYPSGIANSIASQLPIQILSSFFGNTVVGYYSMTQRLLNIPISLIGGSITRVYFKEAVDIQNKHGSARKFTYKFSKIIMLLYSIPAAIVLAFGDLLLPLFLGSNWKGAGIYLQLMIIWNMFYLQVHCFGGFPSVIKMQKRNMINAIIVLIVDLTLMIGISKLFYNPILTILSFVLGHICIHIWFYNDLFSRDKELKNKYILLAFLYLCSVISLAYLLRCIYNIF